MITYKVTGSEMTSVANAIREKGRTSELLSWPYGYVSAIEDISTGGTDIPPDAYKGSGITSFSSDAVYVLDSAFYSCSSLVSVNLPQASYIGNSAFAYCSSLKSVSLPQVSSIGGYAFYSCTSLESVSLPQASYIGNHIFAYCSSLASVSLPQASYISQGVFYYCKSLASVSLPQASYIGSYAFYTCTNLISLYLTSNSLVSLPYSNAFTSTPIGGYSASAGQYGSIFVPSSLYSSYLTATNWSYFSSQFGSI